MSNQYWPIDYALVQAFDSHRRTAVLAHNGLATRLSMAYWVTRGPQTGVMVTPKVLHRFVHEGMDRYMKVNCAPPSLELVAPQRIFYRRPPVSPRVVIETDSFGVTMRRYIDELVKNNSNIVFRPLFIGEPKLRTAEKFLRDLGFTFITYQLGANVLNELTPQVRVVMGV